MPFSQAISKDVRPIVGHYLKTLPHTGEKENEFFLNAVHSLLCYGIKIPRICFYYTNNWVIMHLWIHQSVPYLHICKDIYLALGAWKFENINLESVC